MPKSFQLQGVVPGLPAESEGDGVWLLTWTSGLCNAMKRVNGRWHYGDGWQASSTLPSLSGHLPGKLPEAVTFADVPRPRQIRVRWRHNFLGGATEWLVKRGANWMVASRGSFFSAQFIRENADIDPATPLDGEGV